MKKYPKCNSDAIKHNPQHIKELIEHGYLAGTDVTTMSDEYFKYINISITLLGEDYLKQHHVLQVLYGFIVKILPFLPKL